MKNNAIFARKCEINYQMWIKKCKSGKVSYSLLSYKWRNFQLVNFITICCTTLPRIASHTAHFVCLLSNRVPRANPERPSNGNNRGPQSKPRFICLLWGKAEVRVASTMTESSVCAISSPNATPITNLRLRLFVMG